MELPQNYLHNDGTVPEYFVRDSRSYEIPANVLADKWVTVMGNLLSYRQQQLRELSVTEEDIHTRLGNHISYLDMLRTNLNDGNENFIDFVSQLEKDALERSDNESNYALHHISQLDILVQQAEELLAMQQDH